MYQRNQFNSNTEIFTINSDICKESKSNRQTQTTNNSTSNKAIRFPRKDDKRDESLSLARKRENSKRFSDARKIALIAQKPTEHTRVKLRKIGVESSAKASRCPGKESRKCNFFRYRFFLPT